MKYVQRPNKPLQRTAFGRPLIDKAVKQASRADWRT
jgi:hypothetical protein